MRGYVLAVGIALGLWLWSTQTHDEPVVLRASWETLQTLSWEHSGHQTSFLVRRDARGPYLVARHKDLAPFEVRREAAQALVSSLTELRSDTGASTPEMGFADAGYLRLKTSSQSVVWEVGERGYGHGRFFGRHHKGPVLLLPAALVAPMKSRPARVQERMWRRGEVSEVVSVTIQQGLRHLQLRHHNATTPALAHWRFAGKTGQSLVALEWMEAAWGLSWKEPVQAPSMTDPTLVLEVDYRDGERDVLRLFKTQEGWVGVGPRMAAKMQAGPLVRAFDTLYDAQKTERYIAPPEPRPHDPEHGAPPMRRHQHR